MLLSALVVADRDRRQSPFQVRDAELCGARGQGHVGRRLEEVQGSPPVTLALARDPLQDLFSQGRLSLEASLGVGVGSLEEGLDLGSGERSQGHDLSARDQGPVELEARVLGRGPDQDHGPLLDVGQEGVLLRFVEAVDLVHEEDRALPFPQTALLGLGHDLADLLDPAQDRREGDEGEVHVAGEEPS